LREGWGMIFQFQKTSDEEHTLSLDLVSHVRILNQVGSILTLGQGLGPPWSMLTWNPLGGPSKIRKGGWPISSPKYGA